MFATHYLIVMIMYYKLPTADFLQHTQVFMKQPVLEPRE